MSDEPMPTELLTAAADRLDVGGFYAPIPEPLAALLRELAEWITLYPGLAHPGKGPALRLSRAILGGTARDIPAQTPSVLPQELYDEAAEAYVGYPAEPTEVSLAALAAAPLVDGDTNG